MKKIVMMFVVMGVVVWGAESSWANVAVREFTVATSIDGLQYPVVSGDTIAWIAGNTGSYELYEYNVVAQTTSIVHSRSTRMEDISVGGNTYAWRDYRNDTADVYGLNRSTQSEIAIATGTGTQYCPDVSRDGSVVVWEGAPVGQEYGIYGYNVGNQTTFSTLTNPVSYNDVAPKVDGDHIVWRDYRNGNLDIFGYNINTQTEFPIRIGSGIDTGMRIDGNYVVWANNGGVMGYDLMAEEEFFIASSDADAQPDISGDVVVFTRDWDIYGYNLLTAEEFAICTDSNRQREPRISGNIVTWNDYRYDGSKTSIYGAEILAEPAAIPAPGAIVLAGIGASLVGWLRRRRAL